MTGLEVEGGGALRARTPKEGTSGGATRPDDPRGTVENRTAPGWQAPLPGAPRSDALTQELTFLSLPDPIPANPYQRLLYEACARAGGRLILGGRWPERALLFRPDGPRVLHVHWVWLKEGRLRRLLRALRFRALIALARWRGFRVLVTVHNLEAHEAGPLDRWTTRHLQARADGFIVHDRAARDALLARRNPEVPVAVIPHPSYQGAYPPAPDRTAARTALGLPREGALFLAFGQIRPYKGLEDLVSAFLNDAPAAAQLLIAGAPTDPELSRRLADAAREDRRIHLRLQHVPDAEVPELFAAADWVVQPFRRVTTSGAVHLALAQGRPLIVPRHPGLEEVLGAAAETFDGPADLGPALRRALERDGGAAEDAARTADGVLDNRRIGRLTVGFAAALTRGR